MSIKNVLLLSGFVFYSLGLYAQQHQEQGAPEELLSEAEISALHSRFKDNKQVLESIQYQDLHNSARPLDDLLKHLYGLNFLDVSEAYLPQNITQRRELNACYIGDAQYARCGLLNEAAPPINKKLKGFKRVSSQSTLKRIRLFCHNSVFRTLDYEQKARIGDEVVNMAVALENEDNINSANQFMDKKISDQNEKLKANIEKGLSEGRCFLLKVEAKQETIVTIADTNNNDVAEDGRPHQYQKIQNIRFMHGEDFNLKQAEDLAKLIYEHKNIGHAVYDIENSEKDFEAEHVGLGGKVIGDSKHPSQIGLWNALVESFRTMPLEQKMKLKRQLQIELRNEKSYASRVRPDMQKDLLRALSGDSRFGPAILPANAKAADVWNANQVLLNLLLRREADILGIDPSESKELAISSHLEPPNTPSYDTGSNSLKLSGEHVVTALGEARRQQYSLILPPLNEQIKILETQLIKIRKTQGPNPEEVIASISNTANLREQSLALRREVKDAEEVIKLLNLESEDKVRRELSEIINLSQSDHKNFSERLQMKIEAALTRLSSDQERVVFKSSLQDIGLLSKDGKVIVSDEKSTPEEKLKLAFATYQKGRELLIVKLKNDINTKSSEADFLDDSATVIDSKSGERVRAYHATVKIRGEKERALEQLLKLKNNIVEGEAKILKKQEVNLMGLEATPLLWGVLP